MIPRFIVGRTGNCLQSEIKIQFTKNNIKIEHCYKNTEEVLQKNECMHDLEYLIKIHFKYKNEN